MWGRDSDFLGMVRCVSRGRKNLGETWIQKWAWQVRSRHVWPTVPEAGRVCLHQLKRQARCGSYVGTRILKRLKPGDVLSQDRYLDTHIQRFITRVRELITLFLVEDDLFFPKFPRVPSQSRHAKQSLECWWQLLATTSNTQQCPFWNSILTLSSLLSFQKMNLKTYLIHKFPQFSLQRSNAFYGTFCRFQCRSISDHRS